MTLVRRSGRTPTLAPHRLFAALAATLLLALLGLAPPHAAPAAGPLASVVQPAPAAIVPAFRQASTVAILEIEGPIDRITLRSLERRIEEARRRGAGAVVLRIDTPGGDALATLDICHLVKSDAPPNTVAWVDPQAFSAGTFIALAAREIVMAPNARMGDAAPVSPLMPLPPTERAKIESPLLAEVVDSARRNHYDENLVRAFVTLTPDLWLIEHVDRGTRVVVDAAEFRAVFGSEPPTSAPPSAGLPAGETVTPWINRLFEPSPHQRGRQRGREMTAAERDAEVERAQQLAPLRDTLDESQRGKWRLVHRVVPAGQLLTLSTEEAAFYGFSVATIATVDELRAFFGATSTIVLRESWSERLVRLLVNPWVRGVLLVIFLVCLFVELAAPGFGVFGTTSLVALLLLVGAPMLVGLAQWWEVVLVLAGLGLIAAEIFVIPGFGVAGVAGTVFLLVGLVGTFVAAGSGAASRGEVMQGVSTTVGALLAAGLIIWFLSRWLHLSPLLNRFTLSAQLPGAGGAGLSAATETTLAPGDRGVATTDLRPAGRARFDGRLVDVHSVAGWIEAGTAVRVVGVGRFEVEVEPAP